MKQQHSAIANLTIVSTDQIFEAHFFAILQSKKLNGTLIGSIDSFKRLPLVIENVLY